MVDTRAAYDFLVDLLDEIKEDDVAIKFIGAAVTYYAKDILKRNPDHIYEGCIRGEDWMRAANLILEKRAQIVCGFMMPPGVISVLPGA